MINVSYHIQKDSYPLLATAIHDGHEVRSDVEKYLAIDEFARLLEEDPCTGYCTDICANRLISNISRFQVDFNRPRSGAVYRFPHQSWGLKVWRGNTPEEVWNRSLQEYDEFYQLFDRLVRDFLQVYGFLVIYDIHSYNYKRKNKDEEDDPEQNPEINIGTGTMDRTLWAPVVDDFIGQLRRCDYFGRQLDVRENIKFKGGYLAEWAHLRFPQRVCVLAVELKKNFMDERTGAVDFIQLKEIKKALRETIPFTLENAGPVVREIDRWEAGRGINIRHSQPISKREWRK
jgi:N-formylglutamate amidohydrolase